MRIALLFVLVTVLFNSYGQDLPSDRMILKKIYGKADMGNNTYTRPLQEGEETVIYDSITFRVAYKTKVNLKNKDIFFVATKAVTGGLYGHDWGYEDFYFFEQIEDDLTLIDSIVSESCNLIGDFDNYSIIEIGANKKALILSFQSSGNRHLECRKGFFLLDIGKLTFLLGIDIEYDNSAWKIPENENDDCEATKYKKEYEIIKSNKEWYDIKFHHTEYGFKKGCKNEYIIQEEDLLYIYKDGEYVATK